MKFHAKQNWYKHIDKENNRIDHCYSSFQFTPKNSTHLNSDESEVKKHQTNQTNITL